MARVRSNSTPNALLRAARERLPSPSGSGRPLSRQELADAVNTYLWNRHQRHFAVDHSYIGKLERGEHRWPQLVYREAFRAVLGAATDARIGFYGTRAHPVSDSGHDGAHYRSGTPAPPAPTTAGAGPSAASLAEAILTPIDRDPGSEPAPVPALARLAVRAWRLRQAAHYDELSRLLPDLLTQAEARTTVHDGADREQASRALVHTYNAASSLLRRLGDGPLALVAADRATRIAREIGDPVLVAAAMYRLANVLLADNRLDEARTVALRATDLTAPSATSASRSTALWGGLLLTAAVAAARAAAESQAWELLGEARAASRLLGTDHADIYAIFGPTNVAIHGVQVAVELRNGRDAVRRSRAVDPDRLPASLLDRRGQFLIDVAHAHVLENNDAEAATILLRAERLAPQEVRLNSDARQMTATLLSRERAGANPGLRQLATTMGLTS